MAARARGPLGTDDHVARHVAQVREQGPRACAVTGAGVVVLQGRLDGDVRARNRHDLERLVSRGELAWPLGAAKLTGIGNHDPIARSPSAHRPLECERRVSGPRLGGQAHEGRCLHGPVHRHSTEPDDAVADLSRIEACVERFVGDLNPGGHLRVDGTIRRAHFEHTVRHHDEMDDFHPRVHVGAEREPPVQFDAAERGVALDVVRDLPAGGDEHFGITPGYGIRGPGGGIGPPAARHRDSGGFLTEIRESASDGVDRQNVIMCGLRECGQRSDERQNGKDNADTFHDIPHIRPILGQSPWLVHGSILGHYC